MICLKISTFVVSITTKPKETMVVGSLWFAWKYLSLWYQQQHFIEVFHPDECCDLLKNIYLCGINNNHVVFQSGELNVVICLKISTFVVSTTTLWDIMSWAPGCDLLKNIYLCGINNNASLQLAKDDSVVICLKISTFVVSTTTDTTGTRWLRLLWFA